MIQHGEHADDHPPLQKPNGTVKIPAPSTAPSVSVPRNLEEAARDVQAKVAALLAEEPDTPRLKALQEQVRISMKVVDDALDRYEPHEIALSYNGGKDCLVLLVLILACLPRHFGLGSCRPFPETLPSVYIVSRHPFPEVDEFVEKSAHDYHLDLSRYALPMQQALEAYLQDHPGIKAVFVGTRRTDPHGEALTHFDMTDTHKGWPEFMRVHPVIDWHYVDIWAFLRRLKIPYISLYDKGYTSLGGTTDTYPNPALRRTHPESGDVTFRPAHELEDDFEERLGRER